MTKSDLKRKRAALDQAADDRDLTAVDRDRAATARDCGAEDRDLQAVERERSAIAAEMSETANAGTGDLDDRGFDESPRRAVHLRNRIARGKSRSDRKMSAADRGESAHDRDVAADDREAAALGRADARLDREAAGIAATRALETLEAMSDAFYSIDSDWRFTYLNPQGEQVLQRRSSDILGSVIWDEFPDSVGTDLDDALRRAVREQESVRIEFAWAVNSRLFDVRIHPIPDGLAIYFTDITMERVRLEQQQQAQRLETLGRLTASVAHDFNNLLQVVHGYAKLGQQGSLEREEASKCFEEIDSASQKAVALTRQLLTFGRRQPFSPAPIDLNSAVEDLESILRRLLPASVQIHVACSPEPVIVCLDRSQFDQLLVNLVVNGRDAIEGSGTISVRTTTTCPGHEPPAPCGCLVVTDTGSGIPDDVLAHIFDPYFTTKSPEIGTGLGLATVYGIVIQNGGTIAVDSTLGVGTTFTLCFPTSGPSGPLGPRRVNA